MYKFISGENSLNALYKQNLNKNDLQGELQIHILIMRSVDILCL